MNQPTQQPNYPRPVTPKSSSKIVLIILGVIFGSCGLCGLLGAVGNLVNPKKELSSQIATATPQNSPTVSPSLEANKKSEEKSQQPPAITKPVSNDIDEYRKLLRSIDSKGDIVTGVNQHLTPDKIKITVANSWHYEPYQVRLQIAQKLWEAWAGLHSPNEPDKARIKIVDLNDNEVGGSRVWAGSLIWVQKD